MTRLNTAEKTPAAQSDESRQLATVWPSGVIKRTPAADVFDGHDRLPDDPDSQLGFGIPTSEAELRRARVLTACLRVSPALVRVLELSPEQAAGNQPAYGRDPILPPGERVVFTFV